MNAAEKVIAKFGGQSALARLIGKGQSTVQHWAKTGMIPAKWQTPLLQLAQVHGIVLSSRDFMESAVAVPVREDKIPVARWQGMLPIGNEDLPCFVLDDGRRVISRTGATGMLTGGKGGGNLESYINVRSLGTYIPAELAERMIEFSIPEVVNKTVRGLSAEDFLTICQAYVKAWDDGKLTETQETVARKASIFLSACAKTGLIALIDEATGYQYIRQEDALRLKLNLFLAEEMRKWEKTFPDELWIEFGRLTRWSGPIHSRPKYWGKLVTELIYEYLDPDVADWLKEHVPEPRHGKNYFLWLNEQYGLQKLMQHIWMVIGIAKTCFTMHELREKMAIQFGRDEVQLTFFMPPPSQLPSPGSSN